MVVIEVQGYGDYDVPVTQSVWINPDLDNKSFEVSSLGNFGDDHNDSSIIKKLKAHGFKQVPTSKVIWGGNW